MTMWYLAKGPLTCSDDVGWFALPYGVTRRCKAKLRPVRPDKHDEPIADSQSAHRRLVARRCLRARRGTHPVVRWNRSAELLASGGRLQTISTWRRHHEQPQHPQP